MSIKVDREKIIPPLEKLINKMNMNYYTINELNEMNLLIMKLIKFSEKKNDDQHDARHVRKVWRSYAPTFLIISY